MIKKFVLIVLALVSILFINISNKAHAYIAVLDPDYYSVSELVTYSDYFFIVIDVQPLQKIDSLSIGFGYVNINAELGTFGLHTDPDSTTTLYDINNNVILTGNTINILGATLDDVERLNMLNYTTQDVYRVVIQLNAKREYTVAGTDDNPYPNRTTGWSSMVLSNMTLTISVDEFSNYGDWTFNWSGNAITALIPLNEESFILSLYIPINGFVVIDNGSIASNVEFYDIGGILIDFESLSDYGQYASGTRFYFDVPPNAAYAVFELALSTRTDDQFILNKMNNDARIDINYNLNRVSYLTNNTVTFATYFNSIYLQEYIAPSIPGKIFRGFFYADGVRYTNGSKIREDLIIDGNLYIYMIYDDIVPPPDPIAEDSNWISNIFGSIGFNSSTGYILIWVLITVGTAIASVKMQWSLSLSGISSVVIAGIMFFLGWINLLYVIISFLILVITIMIKGE